MILYAEASAVLAWLLNEPPGRQVRELLAAATQIVASDLTLVECDRALHRAAFVAALTDAEVTQRQRVLSESVARWNVLRLDADVVAAARRRFPVEPLRALDALHLSSALIARASVADIQLLSLDVRLRSAAEALGFAVQPEVTRQG